MKKLFVSKALWAALLFLAAGCSTIYYTGEWKDTEKLSAKSFNRIFIAAMTENISAKQTIENDLAKALEAEGFQVDKSSDYYKPNFNNQNAEDEADMLKKIQELGCDGILTAALVDEKSDTRYVQGNVTYAPFPAHRYYGRYTRYYTHMYPVVYEPGYYANDHFYFFENNFYDADNGDILFSMQSKAVNPTDLNKFSKEYASALIKQLKKNGIIRKR